MRYISAAFLILIILGTISPSFAVPTPPWLKRMPSGEQEVRGRGPSITIPQKQPQAFGSKMAPSMGGLNVICIRVGFTDKPIQGIHDANYFQGVIKHVSDYYASVSNGQLTLNPTISPSAYTLPQPLSYYGRSPQKNEQLIRDTVAASDAEINFSNYGALIIFHAGQGEETSGVDDDIWSQWYYFYPGMETNDGVAVTGASIVPEYASQGSITGTIVHEFGHELGLPDLYDTTGSSNGIGEWCVMSYGGWLNNGETPAELCAWAKAYLGWVTPVVLDSNQTGYVLPQIEDSGAAVKIFANGCSDPKEYFLLENRQAAGWDTHLPGHGLLIWHVDENVGSGSQTNPGHKFVDLEEAEGIQELDAMTNLGDSLDPYYAGNNTVFNSSSSPNSNNYNGNPTNIAVTNISASGPNMTFDLSFGFEVVSVTKTAVDEVLIRFNHVLDPSSANNPNNYSLDRNVGNAISAILQPDNKSVRVRFNTTSLDEIYTLTIANVRDSSLNSLQVNPTVMLNPWGSNVSGEINHNTTWDSSKNPYYIQKDITIKPGVRLTINPGVIIRVANGQEISVYGELIINGNPIRRVEITSSALLKAEGDWKGIVFYQGASNNSKITYARIQHTDTGITCYSTSPTVSSSTLLDFAVAGIECIGSACPIISGNRFDEAAGVTAIPLPPPPPMPAPSLAPRRLAPPQDKVLIICFDSACPMITENVMNISNNVREGIKYQALSCGTLSKNTIQVEGNNKAITCSGSSTPVIINNTISVSSGGVGLACFDSTRCSLLQNTITLTSGGGTGVYSDNSSLPQIKGNYIVSNSGNTSSWCIQYSGGSSPVIVGNTISNPSYIGIAAMGSGQAVICNNNFINNYYAVYATSGSRVADHNYWQGSQNYVSTGISKGYPLSSRVDRLFIPASVLFRNSSYTGDVLTATVGDIVYIELQGQDNEPGTRNSTLVRLSVTLQIMVHLLETSANSGVYRGTATIGTTTSQADYRIAVGEGQTLQAISVIDMSKTDSLVVSGTIIQLGISSNQWAIGSISPGEIKQMGTDSRVVVSNQGNCPVCLLLQIKSQGDWTSGAAAGVNQYALWGLFTGVADLPNSSHFSSDDVITTTAQSASSERFGNSSMSTNGSNLSVGSQAGLYLQFQAPTQVTIPGTQMVVEIGAMAK